MRRFISRCQSEPNYVNKLYKVDVGISHINISFAIMFRHNAGINCVIFRCEWRPLGVIALA
jgi:hypothetical protein